MRIEMHWLQKPIDTIIPITEEQVPTRGDMLHEKVKVNGSHDTTCGHNVLCELICKKEFTNLVGDKPSGKR